MNASFATARASRLTVETALWVLVAAIALTMRLAALDGAPLSGREAHEAMLAWQAVSGQGMPQDNYSPLLLLANAFLFFFCGASDALARLWPALFGTALAVTPLLFRQRVGRIGALAAGLYLALSPVALLGSRQLDGAIPAMAGGMAFLGSSVRFLDTERRSWLMLSAVGLAVAVTASASIYGLLLAVGLAWASLIWAWPSPAGQLRSVREKLRPHLAYALLVFACAALSLSSGLGWNPPGMGAAGGLLAAWFARFGPVSNPASFPFTLLTVYEPFGLIIGLGGLVWAVQHGHRFGVWLGLWAGLGALLLTLMPGRLALDTSWVVLPLALLAGLAMETFARSLRAVKVVSGAWLCAPIILVLWLYLYLRLARYAVVGDPVDLQLALLAIVLQVLVAAVFTLGFESFGVLRASAAGVGVVLLAVTLSAGWGVAYARPADARELLVQEPTAIEVRDLTQTLRDLSWHRTRSATALPLLLEAAPDSVLAWYLRDFSAARRVDDLTGARVSEPAVVTLRREWALAEDLSYAGQDFVLQRSWDPAEITCVWTWPPQCSTVAGWLLFRDSLSQPMPTQWTVLWLRENDVLSATSHSD